jgi:hypothetical protein
MTDIMLSNWFIAVVLIVGSLGGAFFMYCAHKASYSEADDLEDMQEQADHFSGS